MLKIVSNFVVVLLCSVSVVCAAADGKVGAQSWTDSEKSIVRSLWIGNLPPLPKDPTNQYADHPKAAELGKKLFFDTRLSASGQISCATCHDPSKNFTDGQALSRGMGQTRRNAPSIIGMAYSPWFFWDGRADSQWSQALGPLENGVEHGGNRTHYAHVLGSDAEYLRLYESVFGSFPDLSDVSRFPRQAGPVTDTSASLAWESMSSEDQNTVTRVFVNIGKSLAAYERTIIIGPSRFDRYVEAMDSGVVQGSEPLYTEEEKAGLKLFIGKATCVICHSGPLFTNHDFKNVATPGVKALGKDQGRFDGVQKVLNNPFNCRSDYSDANQDGCKELQFIKFTVDDTLGAFKIPGLRNVAKTAPYMHAGQFSTLAEVLKHYQKRPLTRLGHSDLLPFKLTDTELVQLESFLRTLNSDLDDSGLGVTVPAQ
ncbi:MAG: cytochrome-c peroxidase [Gammaproteobacteria bacterium]|nr:cytochrome-c peroxidase [Gammaproteobacteria bacterium]MDH5801529.1 cytochrome-c peroxidase [Gammaproteobacteria bacterium]